jgi:putative ATP-dependent endonuclease of the OLD family
MIIESVTISGFRCFGLGPQRIELSPQVTAVVGANAAGKTALLMALARMFGVTRALRTVTRSDFHVPADAAADDKSTRNLVVDVVISLPELKKGSAKAETIAPVFRHVRIEREEDDAVCRLRLEARWEDDGTAEGAVTQSLFWVDSLDDTPKDETKSAVNAADRGLIQLYYTPASRDAAAQIRASAGALASRLLRAVEWSKESVANVNKATKELTDTFEGEEAIKAIGDALQVRWGALHDDEVDTKPRLSLVSRRFEDVLARLAVIFEQGPDGQERSLDTLSDGQQSLFYFALAAAVFDLERKIASDGVKGFAQDQMRIPALTLFAMEEPENHLSPFYLARIVGEVRSLAKAGGAQAILTSHSPAVLSRVKPVEVRYARRDPKARTSAIKRIKLPKAKSEEGKFVRGALLAYPELYFARFVILVEGDSERVALPKLAEALDLLVDPSFVAIVPLGGRHVQRFWTLLNDLEIPHATLLDLDLGRAGGGWGRIKTAAKHLLEIGWPKAKVLGLDGGQVLADDDLDEMHKRDNVASQKDLLNWVRDFENYGVFFSRPLDLDLSLMHAYPEAYRDIIPPKGGPKSTQERAAAAVLGDGGDGVKAYVGPFEDYTKHFSDYRYHFLTNSKPATHLEAMAGIEDSDLKARMPKELARLLSHVAKNVRKV